MDMLETHHYPVLQRIYDPSTWEVEVQGHYQLQTEPVCPQTSTRPYLKKQYRRLMRWLSG